MTETLLEPLVEPLAETANLAFETAHEHCDPAPGVESCL